MIDSEEIMIDLETFNFLLTQWRQNLVVFFFSFSDDDDGFKCEIFNEAKKSSH